MFALCCWNSTCSRALRMHWAQFLASSQKIWRRRNHRQCPVLRVSLSLSGCGRDDPWIGTFHRSLGTMDGGTVVPFNPWQINLWYVYRLIMGISMNVYIILYPSFQCHQGFGGFKVFCEGCALGMRDWLSLNPDFPGFALAPPNWCSLRLKCWDDEIWDNCITDSFQVRCWNGRPWRPGHVRDVVGSSHHKLSRLIADRV